MKNNIYFIGFMGTGKSTISKHMAAITGYEEIDTDQEIVKKEKMRIPEIFEAYGEEYFRKKETEFLEGMREREYCILWRWNGTERGKYKTNARNRCGCFAYCNTGNYFRASEKRKRTADFKWTYECAIYPTVDGEKRTFL